MDNKSLFERIGGKATLDAAVDIFYNKISGDSSIGHFFKGTDLALLKIKQRTFLSYAFGAPVKYAGKEIGSAHKRLSENGLNEDHFHVFTNHLYTTLIELNISEDLIQEVEIILNSFKNHIVSEKQSTNNNNQNENTMALGKNLGNLNSKPNDGSDLYSKLLMEAADAVVTIDETKSIILWNKAAERIWGYLAEETIGKNINNFVPTEHKQNHDRYVDSNLTTGVDKIVGRGREVEVERKDGSRIPVTLTMSKVQDGDKTFYMAFVKDISAEYEIRRQAEHQKEELQAQEEELRQSMEEIQTAQEAVAKEKAVMQATLEQAIDAIVTINSDKNITFYNNAAEQMFGHAISDVIGKNVNVIVPFEHIDAHDTHIENNVNSGNNKATGKSRELEVSRKDGSKFWINLTLSKVKIEDGFQFTAFIRDITEEKRNFEKMDQSQREIEARIASVDTACIVSETDTRGIITYVNDKHCEVSQYTREELIGSPQNIVRHPDSPKELFKEMWSTIGKGNIFRGFVKNRKKDGTPYYVDGIFTPVLGPNGKPIKYIGVRFDITDTVIESQRMKGIVDAIDVSFAFIEFDIKGNIVTANDNFLKTMEYSLDEIKGNHHKMFVDKDFSYSSDYSKFWADLADGKPQSGQYNRYSKTGKQVWLQAVYSPVKDDMGRIIKVVKVATDITVQKANELEQQRVIEEVNRVVQIAGQEGNLRERLNLTDVKGTNLELVNSINGLLQNISAPIFELKNSIGMMAQGDISQSYDASMAKGDIKEIGDAYNTAIKNLNNLLGNINGIANLVAASSEELLTKADQMQGTTNEMASAIQEMAEGAHQQASQTDDASKLVEGVLRSSTDMGTKAGFINKAAENGQKSSNDGLITVKRVVENMAEIQKSANVTSESINVLSQRSEEIARTLNVITDIASQTNLLALNAAIEAARAGDAGRGFAVVAEEIRKLAEDSRKSAIDIERVIREVQKDINLAGKAIDTMESSVKSGNQASKEAEHVFFTIEKSTTETLHLSLEILNATAQQKDSINETVKNIEKIVVVSEETAAGTEQIASSSKDLSRGMEEVAYTSKDLASVANQLQDGVSKFKLMRS